MHNFVFHNPTKVLFGRSTLSSIGKETALLGRKVLLVYGRHSLKKNGVHEQICHYLDEQGLELIEFGGIGSNPLVSRVREGIHCAKSNGVEVIIAAGGGSVIDTAKAIGAGAVVEHDVWKFFSGKKGVKATLPVNTISTIAGSGSEMNNGMVLTNDSTKEKFGFGHRLLHPVTSILDPELTFSVSKQYTVFGAVDIISHVLEFYLTTEDQEIPFQQRYIQGLIKTVMEACTRCLAKPDNYDARATMMWCSALALNGISAAGLGRVGFPMHLLEHSISGLYNTAHGAGLAAILPGWLSYYQETKPERLADLADALFPQESLLLRNSDDKAELCCRLLYRWLESSGAPCTLNDLPLPEINPTILAEHTCGLAKTWRLREYSPAFMEGIIARCIR